MPRDETLCMQYYRNGTCSKGASCERLHGIYCKVPLTPCWPWLAADPLPEHWKHSLSIARNWTSFSGRTFLAQDALEF